jgi:hypothetical protein
MTSKQAGGGGGGVVSIQKQSDDRLSFGPIIDTLMKLSSSCDTLLNCHQYGRKEVEDESMEEMRPKSAVERVWSKMDHTSSLEVEMYRQFLFEQNSPMPSFEDDAVDVESGLYTMDVVHSSSTPPTTPNRIISRQRS